MKKAFPFRMRPGFTIIELIVAISVIIIITSVAVPRFNSYAETQDFNRNLQGLVSCIQDGRQLAAAPPAGVGLPSIRYVEVRLSPNATTATNLDCKLVLYAPTVTMDTLVAGTATAVMWSKTPVTKTLANVQITRATPQGAAAMAVSNPSSLRIFFGTTENGVPVLYMPCAAGLICPPTQVVRAPANPLGHGISLEMNLTNTLGDTQALTMETLGLPIQLTAL